MCRLFNLFSILLVIIISRASHAEDYDISVVTEDSYPIQFKKDGLIIGPATELVHSVLKRANFSYKIDMYPWARAYRQALKTPNTLIYSLARTPQRESQFHWVGQVMHLNYYLVGLESLKFPQPLTIDYLKTLKIGVIRDSATHQYLQKLGFTKLYTVNKASQVINMLKLNRIDLFPTNYSSFQLSCLHLKFDCQNIKQIYHLEELTTSLYLALSIQTEQSVVDRVISAYKEVITQVDELRENSLVPIYPQI